MYSIYTLFDGKKLVSQELNYSAYEDFPNNTKVFQKGDIISAALFWVPNQDNISEFAKYYRPVIVKNGKKYIFPCEIGRVSNRSQLSCMVRIPLDDIDFNLNYGKLYGTLAYGFYWGFESCEYLKKGDFYDEGVLVNPEKLEGCNFNTQEFYSKNAEILKSSYFKMWYNVGNSTFVQNTGEIKKQAVQQIINFSLLDQIEESFFNTFSIMKIHQDDSQFYNEIKNDYYVNYEWVSKDPNQNKQFDFYKNKIYLGRSSSPFMITTKITKKKILDYVSYLGGVLKILQLMGLAKIFLNDYHFKSIIIQIGHDFYFKNQSGLPPKKSQISSKDILEYSNSIINKSLLINESLINSKNLSPQVEDKSHTDTDSTPFEKEESLITDFKYFRNEILKKMNFCDWFKMYFGMCCKSKRVKNLEQQYDKYKNLISVEKLLETYKEIKDLKQHLKIDELKFS